MNLRRIALISLLCCTVGIPLTGQAETKLVFNVFLPPGHFLRAESARWAAEVEKATEGRVKVEIPAGSLAPPPQQLSAVKSGIADMAVMANVFLGRGAPLTQMSTMPFLVSDASAASVALWRVHEKHLAAKNEFKDVQLLSLFHFSPGYLYSMTDAPVNSVDELKARRMWALPGEAADVMKS
ncbi:MAG: TRAP transporter substrate-binding protein DctP, partial [Burkholderiales bacterium]